MKTFDIGRLGETQIVEGFAAHDLGRIFGDWVAGGFADIGHGARGAGVDLEHIHNLVFDGILHIHQPLHPQRHTEALGVITHNLIVIGADFDGRQDTGAIARMHTCFFDMLHHPHHYHIVAIANGIDIGLE